jgi:hypothetical protein
MSCVEMRKYAQKILREANEKEKEVEDYLVKKLNKMIGTSWIKFIKFETFLETEYSSDRLICSHPEDKKVMIELSLNTFYLGGKKDKFTKAIFTVDIIDKYFSHKSKSLSFLHGKTSQSEGHLWLNGEALLEMENYAESYKDKLPEIIRNIYQLKVKMLEYPILEIQRACIYLIAIGKFHHFLHKDICILMAKNIWKERYTKIK